MTTYIFADFGISPEPFLLQYYPVLWIDKRMLVIDIAYPHGDLAADQAWLQAIVLAKETGAQARRFSDLTSRRVFVASL